MEQQHKKPAANSAASSPASSGSSSSSRSLHGSMSSAFLGVSSSTHSQRRSSPSLCPPPAPARLPGTGHLGSRGSAASGGSASGSSSSQFHQISPSPGASAKRRPRPSIRLTHSLPSPFLSELSAIRRMSANIFGDLNVQEMTQRQLLHGQQEQEMTRLTSSLTIPHSHHHTSIPIGDFSGSPSASQQQQALTMRGLRGFARPPPLQQEQAQPSFSSLQPLPDGNFSTFPLPASLPQQMQPSSSFTDLTADYARPSSDSALPPLPPSLEIRQYGLPLPSPLGQLSRNNGSSTESTPGFMEPSSNSVMYELAPLPESLQMPPLLQQINQDPIVSAPCLEPEIISREDGNELSALVNSFASSRAHGPNNLEDRLQLGGSSSRLGMRAAAEGGAQTWEAIPTPASVHDKVNTGGSSSSSIPWNCHSFMAMYSQSEHQALQQLSNLLSVWSSTASSRCDQSMGSSVAGNNWAAVSALANKFDIMNIDGRSAGTKMPSNYSSSSVENSTHVPAMPKLILAGMDRPGLPAQPPALGASPSSSMPRRGSIKEHYFSEAEMETINKDNRLKELMKTDSKRVKRIVRNREYVARIKVQKANYIKDLQRRADALEMECSALSAQVQSHQEMFDKLRTKNREVEIKLKGLKELAKLKQALNHQLQSELQRLKLLEHNTLCANGIHNSRSS